jgi:hypothetical protein
MFWRLRFGRPEFRRSGFDVRLGTNRRLIASRFIDVTASFRLARGGFQGALTGGELALRQVQIAGPTGGVRTAGAGRRRGGPLPTAGRSRRAASLTTRRWRDLGRARPHVDGRALIRATAALGLDHHGLGAAMAEALAHGARGHCASRLQR